MKILIVDDSKTILRINAKIVESLGYESIKAENGKEALDIVINNDIKLILLDVNMPIMNGFEFLAKTKELRKEKDIKTFMCTTEAGRNEVIKALQLGANNYITKPIQKDVLIEKIKDLKL